MPKKNTLHAVGMLYLATLFSVISLNAQTGVIINANQDQKKLVSAYRFVLEQSDDDYRANEHTDAILFPEYGEFSVYRSVEGEESGNFIYANTLPDDYTALTHTSYSNYNWEGSSHVAVQFKKHPGQIAIFKSQYQQGNASMNWEAIYFERLFSEFLMDNISYTIDESTLASEGLDEQTSLLIIPAFLVLEEDFTYYIDSILSVAPDFKENMDSYLAHGGAIYAEGNAAYFIQQLGYLEAGTVNYSGGSDEDGTINILVSNTADILSLGSNAANSQLYTSQLPTIGTTGIIPVVTTTSGNPCLFRLKPARSLGGRIICNTGLPTVSGISDPYASSGNQLSWTLNTILSVFSYEIDVTRKVRNEILYAEQLGDNSIPYDQQDTLEVDIRIRNLSNETITITLTEKIKAYFEFVDVPGGEDYILNGNSLIFSGMSLAPHTEQIITYRVSTAAPNSKEHEEVDKYLDRGTLMAVGNHTLEYTKDGYRNHYNKNKNFADILFSARIFADTDVNYKNFLGLVYQPFKVFMIMENKSRSAAENTQYVQYIPKDVPFYWSDQSLNIPILKTPGGEYVDVLRGSNDEDQPEFDMDSDGDPDVWLDTTSIYPKGYTLTEESVYWANPWNHLRTGEDNFVFEDIYHDGIVPLDTDGDGIVDANFDEDDKIRVWKLTWDIGRVAGYEYYDPYCSYEIWVDPPDLVPLSAGVADAHDSLLVDEYPGMFYPYNADITDTTWSHWMERDENGKVIWDQLIHQKINNYEGFTWVDTAEYTMLPTDSLIGTTPQPHREFLAVLSLGGEEIDMRNYTPHNSLYSNVTYETVFGEEKVTPIRTTYSYWAPLPNPLQFEYLSNNYQAFDTTGAVIEELPEHGKAHLVFDMDASTEYTYYWIRNVGYDVDYNDASEEIDGVGPLGDGVFGYFVYSIPKGLGGYRITLPKNEDGSFNTDSIVQIDDQYFTKWIDNPNTWNEVEIWESPFAYDVYIPQLLIPPALDDDDFDGIDDWIDDRGDRFCSKTGYLHDAFMTGDGEDYTGYPAVPFTDDIYGQVDSGWYAGADDTYGDDFFETLGKTHITIHADYEGRGREGSVEISKGGVLVCEEIFGGSPWVIFSHVLSGYAKGTDLSVTSVVTPELVYYGVDTVFLKHTIADTNEPHRFDRNFDPYHVSYGHGKSTITTYVGATDPCSLIAPAVSMPASIDPDYDQHTLTLVPNAGENPGNPDLANYPRTVTGSFMEIRVEVGNSTENNWINTCVKPQISADIGSIEMCYVAYPRPLVPSHAEGGELIPGDQPGTFTTGWRFNQPESEVLIKMGDTLNLIQPTRRAYFVFLVKINAALKEGVYSIPFTLSGEQIFYDGTAQGAVSYTVPNAMFSIVEKDENGQLSEYQQLILDQAELNSLEVNYTNYFEPTGDIRYSNADFDYADFGNAPGTLTASGSSIDLSQFGPFPSLDTSKLVIMQKGTVDSYNTNAEILVLTNGQILNYTDLRKGDQSVASESLVVRPVGPRIRVTNTVYSINGIPVSDTIVYESDEDLYIQTLMTVRNTGTDISSNTIIRINPGPYYTLVTDSLEANCTVSNGILLVDMGDIIPGELKKQYLPFLLYADEIPEGEDLRVIIDLTNIDYEGTLVDREFAFEDPEDVVLDVYDFEAISISYSDLGDGQVQVNAEAHNRGINGNGVWFRIYPVVGGGVHEFPIAEARDEEFLPGEDLELEGVYTLPETDQAIEFIAIIDDAMYFTEITELNNRIGVPYTPTVLDYEEEVISHLEVYPNPFAQQATFSYTLAGDYQEVNLKVYSTSGDLLLNLENCPGNNGRNSISWQRTDMEAGVYYYRMSGKTTAGQSGILFKGTLIKTDK
ncbi:MAG: T9SS type A sorting domain-containing protein [Bacteroidales bacterium]|nr:T9SS type A sorting domain-containing protein [Bacteroidales bacterium]